MNAKAIARRMRRLRDRWYARRWGLPRDAFDEDAQRRVAAILRSHSVQRFGVTDEEWESFVDAHQGFSAEAS